MQIRHPFWYGISNQTSLNDQVNAWGYYQHKLFTRFKDIWLHITVSRRTTLPILVEIEVPCVDARFTNILSDQAYYMAAEQNNSSKQAVLCKQKNTIVIVSTFYPNGWLLIDTKP